MEINTSGRDEDDNFPIPACLDEFYSRYTTAMSAIAIH